MTNPLNSSAASGAPLEGLRVLEFGQFIAVPAAGQALLDLGAEVIKIEPASGDSARRVAWSKDDFGPMFAPYNRGKRSVVLDLIDTARLRSGEPPRTGLRRDSSERTTGSNATSRALRGHPSRQESPTDRCVRHRIRGRFTLLLTAWIRHCRPSGERHDVDQWRPERPAHARRFHVGRCHGRPGSDNRSSRRARTPRSDGRRGSRSTCR